MRRAAALLGLRLLVGGCNAPTGPEEARLTNLTTGAAQPAIRLTAFRLTAFRTVDQLFAQARERVTRNGVVLSMAFDTAVGHVTSNVAPVAP